MSYIKNIFKYSEILLFILINIFFSFYSYSNELFLNLFCNFSDFFILSDNPDSLTSLVGATILIITSNIVYVIIKLLSITILYSFGFVLPNTKKILNNLFLNKSYKLKFLGTILVLDTMFLLINIIFSENEILDIIKSYLLTGIGIFPAYIVFYIIFSYKFINKTKLSNKSHLQNYE